MVTALEVRSGVSWREAWTAALAPLFEAGDALAADAPIGRRIVLSFWLLGREHPLYRVFHFQGRDDGYALELTPSDDAIAAAMALIQVERRCCPFLRFTLTIEPGETAVELTLTGGDGVREFLAAALRPGAR